MLNFKEIENRIKKRTGLTEGKDIAALFKLTPQNYSNKKGLGTILPTIIEWAIQENVNLDWLLKGEQPDVVVDKPEAFESAGFVAATTRPIVITENRKTDVLTQKLQRIIQEGDKTKLEALKATLKAFDPGEKKQRVDCTENERAGAARDRAA